MRLGDLNPSVSTGAPSTITGSTKRAPQEGEETKVDGLTDQSNRDGIGLRTRDQFNRNATGTPLERERPRERMAPGLKPSTPLEKQPQSSGRPKVKGGVVDLFWEDPREDEEQSTQEDEELDKEAAQLEQELVDVIGRMAQLRERSSKLGTDKFNLGEQGTRRQQIMNEYLQGTAMKMYLLAAEEQEETMIGPIDLAVQLGNCWTNNWELFNLSKQTDFARDDIVQTMSDVSRLMPEVESSLREILGQDGLRELLARHAVLAKGLDSNRGVTRELGKLFPRESAGEIMAWYQRLAVGLLEMRRVARADETAKRELGYHIKAYPGPLYLEAGENRSQRSFGRQIGLSGSVSSQRINPFSAVPEGTRINYPSVRTKDRPELEPVENNSRLGYDFRPGSNPLMTSADVNPQQMPIYHDVSRGLLQSGDEPGMPNERSFGRYPNGYGTSSAGGGSDLDTETASGEIRGFEGMTREEILEQVGEYAEEKLLEYGQMSELALSTIMENFPRMGVYPKAGREESITKGFPRAAREIKPYIQGAFISVPKWWQQLNDVGDDNGWSIPYRIRFLARTGGLENSKKYEAIRTLVEGLMRDMKSWLSYYNRGTSVMDNQYWFKTWVDVSVKIISEFHTVQHSDAIMEGIKDLCNDSKYTFVSKTDPLNEDFFRVVLLYQDVIRWLKERSSDLVNSPLYVYQILKKWLEAQGEKGVGKVMANHIEKALAKLSTHPEEVFPLNHGLTRNQLDEVRRRGQGRATMNTYRLVLEKLKRRAIQKDLTFELYSFQQIDELYGARSKDGKSGNDKNIESDKSKSGWTKKERKSNATVTTDVSTLTSLNTTTVSDRPQPCAECRMFHEMSGGCKFWDKDKRMFNIGNFLKHRSVIQINADGSLTFNAFWKNKLISFGFPGMGITQEADKKKILDDIEAAIKKLPHASIEERKRYAEKNKRFINLATTEASGPGTLATNIDALANNVTVGSKSSRKRSGRGKKKSKSKDKDDSSDEQDSDSDDDSEGSNSN
jgi:hypothetical protein